MKPSCHFGNVLRLIVYTLTIATIRLGSAYGEAQWIGEKGVLPRGTAYEFRKPENWNGTLISDLDFAMGSPLIRDFPFYDWLLNHGYALAGTARRNDRLAHYDPAHELIDLINVMDLFQAKFGKPSYTIQLGRSGGGHIALAMAETHPAFIDGALSLCAHTPIWQMNANLDTWFTLQTLIAPNLQITGIRPKKGLQNNFIQDMLATSDPELTAAWRSALEAAQKTAIGRARIALAITIGQQPAVSYNPATIRKGQQPPILWSDITKAAPSDADIAALERSMYELLAYVSTWPGGQGTMMFELSSPGGRPEWNTGIDYVRLFRQGEPAYQRATRALYAKGGGNLDADIAKLNSAKRVEADPQSVKYWSVPGRTVTGEPKVPVLRVVGTQDPATAASLAGYAAAVEAHGYGSLFRTAFVDADGHCNYTVGELAASLETLMHRLTKGEWGATSAEAMNKLAVTLDPPSDSRFVSYTPLQHSRTWVPAPNDLMGLGPLLHAAAAQPHMGSNTH